MKNKKVKEKKKKNSDYSKLKIKIFIQISAMMVMAVIIIFMLYSQFWFRRVGDWIVDFLQNAFYLDYEDAFIIYQYTIRNNRGLIVFGAVTLCFLLLFRFFLSWFTKYFNEIDRGLESLINGDNKEISLSPEMAVMERKLNTLRETLEKRELEAKLEEERKNSLVVYLAHDIRTPLTSVIGYLSLLEEAPDMPPEQKAKYVHITLEKANRLEQLINEFFEITRYNLQEIILEKETIDLYYMMVQMIEEFYPQLSAKGNTAVLHSDENITVSGDPVKLARVFNNILKNAIAYSYVNTQIDIFVERLGAQKKAVENGERKFFGKNTENEPRNQGEKVRIMFKNKGRTIPKEKLSTIFERFYRMDEARTSDTGGAGLGLSIAKEIVTIHGGTIFAESENEQVVFVVELPV